VVPLTFFDAVDAANIPAGAQAMAGYVDGAYRSLGPMRVRLPEALWLSIATSPSSDAMVLDVEQGDAGPTSAVQWVVGQLRQGVRRPCLYVGLSNVPGLLAALAHSGIQRQQVRLWTAHWTGIAHICGPECGISESNRPGATQYESLSRRGVDTNLTTLEWFDAVRHTYLNRGTP